MRRTISVLACTGVILLLLAPAATATKPFQIRISDPASLVLPAGDFCDFAVRVDVTQKFKVIEFAGDRGTWITGLNVGKIKAVLTKLSAPRTTMALSIPGPGFFDRDGNLVRGTGPWLIFVPGELLYIRGNITFGGVPPFVVPLTVRGSTLDLCEALG
jgi:hypothetical protein